MVPHTRDHRSRRLTESEPSLGYIMSSRIARNIERDSASTLSGLSFLTNILKERGNSFSPAVLAPGEKKRCVLSPPAGRYWHCSL